MTNNAFVNEFRKNQVNAMIEAKRFYNNKIKEALNNNDFETAIIYGGFKATALGKNSCLKEAKL